DDVFSFFVPLAGCQMQPTANTHDAKARNEDLMSAPGRGRLHDDAPSSHAATEPVKPTVRPARWHDRAARPMAPNDMSPKTCHKRHPAEASRPLGAIVTGHRARRGPTASSAQRGRVSQRTSLARRDGARKSTV